MWLYGIISVPDFSFPFSLPFLGSIFQLKIASRLKKCGFKARHRIYKPTNTSTIRNKWEGGGKAKRTCLMSNPPVRDLLEAPPNDFCLYIIRHTCFQMYLGNTGFFNRHISTLKYSESLKKKKKVKYSESFQG